MKSRITQLEISNLRSFRRDAVLRFAPGVTIVCAPNGVGKTSLFEALELALAGRVRRLGASLDPLVRDGEQRASVALSWVDAVGDEARAEVVVDRGAGVVVRQPSVGLLHHDNEESLPYLLRLTHLLEQQTGGWLARSDGKSAANALNQLPVGRDAAVARAALTGAKGEASKRVELLVQRADLEGVPLDRWRERLAARDQARANTTTPGRDLWELAEVLRLLASRTGAGALPKEVTVESLAALAEACLRRVRDSEEELTRRASVVAGLPAVVVLADQLKAAHSDAEVARLRAVAWEGERGQVSGVAGEALRVAGERRTAATAADAALRERARVADEEFAVVARVQALLAGVESSRVELSVAEEELQGVATRAAAVDSRWSQFRQLETVAKEQASQAQVLEESREAIERWRQASASLVAIDEADRLLAKTQVAALAEVEEANISLAAVQAEVSRVTAAFAPLRDALGAVSAAVASIAENLPDDAHECPVCLIDHGRTELRRRILIAQERVSPALQAGALDLKAAGAREVEARSRREVAGAALERVRNERLELARSRTPLQTAVVTARQVGLLPGLQLDAAATAIADAADRLAASLAATPAPIEAEPTPQERATAAAEHAAAAARRDALRVRESQLGEELTRVRLLLPSEPHLGPSPDELRAAGVDRANAEAAYAEASEALASAVAARSIATSERERASESVAERASAVAQALAQWRGAGMTGDPSTAAVAVESDRVAALLGRAADDRAVIDALQVDIGAWRAANAVLVAQAEVDALRGQDSEEVHTVVLEERVASAAARLVHGRSARALMDQVDAELGRRLERAQNEIVSPINPLMQALLGRIVRNPRFASASLKLAKSRSGATASTEVTLHGGPVPVDLVASEAQLTDIQICSLLAMAVKHAWSPWRGLLLDDPTQHHDIVHAAGVFDVLRDYVAEFDFQVVIATHDAVHAEFLARKLRNDGIDHAYWTLVPETNGVMPRLRSEGARG